VADLVVVCTNCSPQLVVMQVARRGSKICQGVGQILKTASMVQNL
jgi:hypothetical protein